MVHVYLLHRIDRLRDSNAKLFFYEKKTGDADVECKPGLPELEIKRIVLPFNTVNNRHIVQ